MYVHAGSQRLNLKMGHTFSEWESLLSESERMLLLVMRCGEPREVILIRDCVEWQVLMLLLPSKELPNVG